MTAQNHPRLTLRDLFVIIAVVGLLLAAAAQYRSAVWLVLVPVSFYLPFLLICTLARRPRTLVLSVVAIHTAIVLLWPLAMLLAYGAVDPIPVLATLAIIDLPLLPLYLALDLHPYIALPVSIVFGGLIYALIAYGLFRWRYGAQRRAD